MSNPHRENEGFLSEDDSLNVTRERSTPVVNVDSEWDNRISMDDLVSTIETAIIPRLLVSYGAKKRNPESFNTSKSWLKPDTVEIFAKQLFSSDSVEAAEFVEDLLNRGVTMDVLLLDLMAPAARLLGDMWTADLCTFVDVTLGLSRMHKMLRNWSSGSERTGGPGFGYSALLVPAPGEQHTFGLRIVEEFLLRDGWKVRSKLTATYNETVELVSSEYFDIIGFTLGGETLLKTLTSAIGAVRQASHNRSICVIVGGCIFNERPELVSQVGADCFAADAADALRKVNARIHPASIN